MVHRNEKVQEHCQTEEQRKEYASQEKELIQLEENQLAARLEMGWREWLPRRRQPEEGEAACKGVRPPAGTPS